MAFALLSRSHRETQASPAKRRREAVADRSPVPLGLPLRPSGLKISKPTDSSEREADRIAAAVMQGSRAAARTTAAPAGRSVDPPRTGGRPLSPDLRAFFEPRFGSSLEQVRLHTDARTNAAAGAIAARAFTIGSDIGFAAGEFAPRTSAGRRLLAHELAHAVQQHHAAEPATAFRTPYEGCSEATTFEKNWKPILDRALVRARDFADVAISALKRDPDAEPQDRPYPLALRRHFLGLTATQRKAVRANFIKLRDELKPERIRCVKADADVDFCLTAEKGVVPAFMRDAQDWLCPLFWVSINRNCMAMTLIHEAAHIIGLGDGATHPPYRGSDEYPAEATTPKSGQTAGARMDNPDAYAYFAAHIWREVDSKCAVFFQTIEIKDTTPAPPSTSPESSK